MSAVTGLSQARRTRLTPARESEVFNKVVELVVEEGYDNLTMDTIATRTRSSKATLYRQWGGKPQLVAAALGHAKHLKFQSIDTGSACGDLRELARRFGASDNDQAGIFWSMADSIRRNPDLKAALREALFKPAERELGKIMQRAVDRGEISPDNPSFDFVQCTMMGASLSHSIIEDSEADCDFMLRFVNAVVLPALGVQESIDVDVPSSSAPIAR